MRASLQNLATLFRIWTKNEKVHRVLEFHQSKWLKSYIEFNTQKIIETEKT